MFDNSLKIIILIILINVKIITLSNKYISYYSKK